MLQALADAAALAFANVEHRQAFDEPDKHRTSTATAGLLEAAPRLPTREIFYRVIVIGTSAGGIAALLALLSRLPEDLAAPVFLVLHTSRSGASKLSEVLSRAGALPVSYAQDGEPIRP
ncbi:MAG: chemotaxis protein CheB [Ignavibacteriales bacterium]